MSDEEEGLREVGPRSSRRACTAMESAPGEERVSRETGYVREPRDESRMYRRAMGDLFRSPSGLPLLSPSEQQRGLFYTITCLSEYEGQLGPRGVTNDIVSLLCFRNRGTIRAGLAQYVGGREIPGAMTIAQGRRRRA